DSLPDGVVIVPLAPLRAPELIATTILQAVGVGEESGRSPETTLLEWLRDKRLLLLLDNVEHVAGAAAPLLVQLLSACPRLILLLTSRTRVRARGERMVPVVPLALPEPAGERASAERPGDGQDSALAPAVALFLERAQAVLPDLALTPDNSAAIAEI